MRTLLLGILVCATAATAGEATYVFASEEDPATPPDAAFCATAGFFTNAKLGASLYSVKTSREDGRVTKRSKKIGRATACLGITSLLFPAGLTQNFFVRFELPQGTYIAKGTCTVASNNVPVPYLILAGCSLKLVSGPAGTLGGVATSNSVLNPLHQAGFSTGSTWTLHEYLSAAVSSEDHDEEDE